MMFTQLFDIATRIIKWDKSLGIQTNGESNDYPERMRRLKENSVTASMASDKMFKFVSGKGFGDEADKIKIGKVRITDFADDIAHDIVDDRGVFVHVNYSYNVDKGKFYINRAKVVPFENGRIGEIDDRHYNGKILTYYDWCGNIKKSKIGVYDVFNPDKEVILAQIKKAGGIKHYKGQILYYNMDRRKVYPLSRIHAVHNDCDSESLASIYKQRTLKHGFFGKTLIITRSLVGKALEMDFTPDGIKRLHKATTERQKFKEAWSQFIGVENYGEALHMEVDFAGDDLEKSILIKNIESKIDPELFSGAESSVRTNILMAYNNLPEMLVKTENSVFGNSGKAFQEAQLSYQDSTQKERGIVEDIVNEIYLLTEQGENKPPLVIKKLIDEPIEQTETQTT